MNTFVPAIPQVLVPGSKKSVTLQPLHSDTEYKITVNPIYPEGEGAAFSQSSTGHTCESLLRFLVPYLVAKLACDLYVFYTYNNIACEVIA